MTHLVQTDRREEDFSINRSVKHRLKQLTIMMNVSQHEITASGTAR